MTLANGIGTIDADYRGALGAILINHGADEFHIKHGDRIAQIIFAPVVQAEWVLVKDLDEIHQGQGSFGSTGRG